MEKPFKKIGMPSGLVEMYEATDPDYPGVWIDINGEQAALVEHDHLSGKPTVRVWNGEDEDYIFRQEYEAEEKCENAEEELSPAVNFILDELYRLTQKEEKEELSEGEREMYMKMVEFLREEHIPIAFGITY